MTKKKLINTIQGLGLTESEAQIYLANLALGPTTIQKISGSSGIKRTTVYSVIDSLIQKGLVNVEVKGFKRKFVAENPEKLENILEERREKFKDNLPELMSLYNLKGGESIIKYYEGVEGMKTVYDELLKDVEPNDDYYVVSESELWYKIAPEYFEKFLSRRSKMRLNVKLLLQDSEKARHFVKFQRNYNTKAKILPKGTSFSTNLTITPQKVVIHQLYEPIMAIVIENKSVIKMNQDFFEVMWKFTEGNKYQKISESSS